MHISEGVLSAPVLAAGAALTAGGVTLGLRKVETEDIPKVAVLSSAFFVASLIHVPVGPTSVHLILNGLTGLLLGWAAFPAILVGAILQAVLFQFGGITVLGVNTFNLAFPGVVCYYLFASALRRQNSSIVFAAACAAGAVGIALSGALISASLVAAGESFLEVAKLTLIAHVPVMVIEAALTGFCVAFLHKVKPELLMGRGES